uniref:Uncharacterized protein n=1 Tax=Arundo donax TaxID=35708 RepID=A0A0A8XUL2_ARUDO
MCRHDGGIAADCAVTTAAAPAIGLALWQCTLAAGRSG